MRILSNLRRLGTHNVTDSEEKRHIILSNNISLALIILTIIILIADAFENPGNFPDWGQDTFGAVLFGCGGVVGLLMNWGGINKLSRLFVSLIPILSLQLFPLFVGMAIDEFYFWYPYGIVIASIIPQVIFSLRKEKQFYIGILTIFFVYLLFIDNLLISFETEQVSIVPIVNEHRLFYKLVPIFCFLFSTVAVTYLNVSNSRFEEKMKQANVDLNKTIIELKKAQQNLVQSEKMASLGTLTAGVAHEINNPLNFISGGTALIDQIRREQESSLPNDLKLRYEEALNIVNEGVDRTTKIVKGLETFSFQGKEYFEESDIHEIINNTLLFLQASYVKDVVVKKDFEFKGKVVVLPHKIHQLVINIIDNALDEVKNLPKERKKILIHTSSDNEWFQMKISNYGEPIKPDVMKHLFDPFFTTKEPGQGTGLGLSICYSIIQEHKGRIDAVNDDDKVSFIVKLPLQRTS